MEINEKGLELLKTHEGYSDIAYRDVAGHPTIGFGHKILDNEHFAKITMERAEELLKRDLKMAEKVVYDFTDVIINENQFSALVSWTYNLGAGAFRESTMRKRLNERKFHLVPGEMMRWVIAGGKVWPGLIKRRAEEALLFIDENC